MTDSDIAYVAGFFDGEGCLNFFYIRNNLNVRCMIVNTNKDILIWIQSLFGGTIKGKDWSKSNRPTWKTSYTLRLGRRSTRNLINIIYPYLRVKQVQADIVKLFFGTRPGNGKDCDKELDRSLFIMLRKLNKKGITI